jgi:hypothetical protein
VIKEVTSVKAPCLGVTFVPTVGFHHFVVNKPQTFWHVAEVSSFPPNAEVQYKVNNTTNSGRRSGYAEWVHFGEAWSHSHCLTPFHIIRENLQKSKIKYL